MLPMTSYIRKIVLGRVVVIEQGKKNKREEEKR